MLAAAAALRAFENINNMLRYLAKMLAPHHPRAGGGGAGGGRGGGGYKAINLRQAGPGIGRGNSSSDR